VSRLPVAADPGPEFDAEFGDDVASGTAAQHAPTDTAYTRSGVAAAIRSAVTGVDGIRSASVKLKRHQVKVSATSAATDRAAADALRAPVTAAIEHRLDDLRLQSRPSLSLSMAPRSR
jgi:copper chaperone CopZ